MITLQGPNRIRHGTPWPPQPPLPPITAIAAIMLL